MVPVLRFWSWTSGSTPPPPPDTFAGMGGGFPAGPVEHRKPNPYEHERKVDREQLREILESAFADAPRDPVVREVRRQHAEPNVETRQPARVDWERLLADLGACVRVLDRYASRLAKGQTRTQRAETNREHPRYSADTVREVSRRVTGEARRARNRKLALMLLLDD